MCWRVEWRPRVVCAGGWSGDLGRCVLEGGVET